MVGHIDLLYPIVKQGILENYGWQEEEDEDDDNSLPKVGPFSIYSWAMYMKDNLVWGDSVILSLLASVWSVRVTIVGSRTLHEIRFRHDLDLEFSDIALVFNTSEENGHYSGFRRNQEVCATRRLTFSKKWNKEKDAAERLSLFQDDALEVIQKSEVQLSIVKSSRMKSLESRGEQLAKVEKFLKRKWGDGEEDTEEENVKKRREEIVVREKDIQEVNAGDDTCHKCKRKFPRTFLLMCHIDKYHKHVFMYNCKICNKGFMTVRGYEEHEVRHGEKKFKCSECGEGFGTKGALSQHIRELCSPEAKDKEYNCDHCAAGPFKVKRYLQTHLKSAQITQTDHLLCNVLSGGGGKGGFPLVTSTDIKRISIMLK